MRALLEAAVAGLAGAAAVTLIHESARRSVSHAPRMDVLGRRAISSVLHHLGVEPPVGNTLQASALAGDLVSNTAYYGLVGAGSPETAPVRGAVLGLLGGLAGVTLPGPMGLGTQPSARTWQTQAMTIAWYTVGGIAAGLVYERLAEMRD